MSPGIRSAEELLAKNFEKYLNIYSASALAAGVSLLALAKPAEAEIVVTHVDIPICNAAIDLNKDGTPDFSIPCYTSFYEHTFYARMMVEPLAGGEVVGGARGSAGPYASALSSGAKIGPSAHFSSSVGIQQLFVEGSAGWQSTNSYSGWGLIGQWGNKGYRYLGVKFLIKGETHYGWIRMSVTRKPHHQRSLNGTISEYAYETIANKEIGAGATSDDSAGSERSDGNGRQNHAGPSLGMLAAGAQGFPMWRR